MHRWKDRSFIDWAHQAMYEPPARFAFYMNHPADEVEDINYMAKGYPCKSHD